MNKLLLLFLGAFSFSYAQTDFTKKYIMPFHYCAAVDCAMPTGHKTTFAESNDGANWTLVPNVPLLSGSVPDAIIRDTLMYIFNPGTVRYYNFNTKLFDASTQVVTIHDQSNNLINFVDPSPILDDNGNIVLIYLNTTGLMGDPAFCSTYPCTKYFNSAIEVPGSNGTQFIQQSGDRLALTINSGTASDPDVFFDGTNYNLYISKGTSTVAYSSPTLHGSYTVQPLLSGGTLTNNGGIPSGHFDPITNQYWTYVHANGGGPTEIRALTHPNFNSTVATYTTLITGVGYGFGAGSNVASPGFLENSFLNLSLPKNEDNSITIYPNPASHTVQIHSLSGSDENYSIYDIKGEIYCTGKLQNGTQTIHVESLEIGMYFIQVGDVIKKFNIVND